jgi:predicted DsbA family dithiol-disulfide isomerase
LGQEYSISVVGRAYLLRPDTPKEGRPRQPRPGETQDELAEPLRTHAREASLVMRPPKVTPNTMYALEATEYAQQQGKFLEFHQAAYRAYWSEGKDLGDLGVLEELARATALDWGELRQRLEGHHYTAAVMGQYQEALQHGIQGIPTFVVGNLLFTGAHPYPVFQAAMRRVLGQGPLSPGAS